ncbi:hypothetical protein ABT063_00380 [Streptomyces sp. NPDC002838]|uniref:hypothetical protein n=1 Tax=Streptomyces sp. NPDC002838 TaxID=3154436 RepID=UPI003322DE6D
MTEGRAVRCRIAAAEAMPFDIEQAAAKSLGDQANIDGARSTAPGGNPVRRGRLFGSAVTHGADMPGLKELEGAMDSFG